MSSSRLSLDFWRPHHIFWASWNSATYKILALALPFTSLILQVDRRRRWAHISSSTDLAFCVFPYRLSADSEISRAILTAAGKTRCQDTWRHAPCACSGTAHVLQGRRPRRAHHDPGRAGAHSCQPLKHANDSPQDVLKIARSNFVLKKSQLNSDKVKWATWCCWWLYNIQFFKEMTKEGF